MQPKLYIMKMIQWAILLSFLFCCGNAYAQVASIKSDNEIFERTAFFSNEAPINITILTDFHKMRNERVKGIYQAAKATIITPNGASVTEEIQLYARGNFRRQNCQMPGIMINFKNESSTVLSGLKKIKLVCGCSDNSNDEQLLLKEYLIYKLYNIITEKSFGAKLVKLNYQDSKRKMKGYSQHAFFIEDVDDMAARNNCYEVENKTFATEATHRKQTTIVSIFQFMIGNTDWSVPVYHNIKLMQPINDSTAKPYAVPYDFDYCGLVDAYYAIPHPSLNLEKITDRLYRGFPRTMEEIQEALNVFRQKKEAILTEVQSFELLNKYSKAGMIKYLNEFFSIIEKEKLVQTYFIDGARVR